MKKNIKIFSAAILICVVFAFSGCDFFKEAAQILAPSDTWCQMNIPVGEAQVCMNVMYTDSEWVGKSKSTNSFELAEGFTIEPGITIVITLDNESDSSSLVGSVFEGLTSSAYILKTFPSDGSDLGFGSQSTWATAYIAKDELRYSDQVKMPTVPIQLTYGGKKLGAQDISDLKNFSWEKILINYLAAKLE